ncbi:hypothetical protein LSTR_LSTR011741 [Laodelphax striatellus]|uniref:I/LWEQ domain-containing protein n=1 Tax=Laodelphax striatellus TaxID=195883 RepID=A0A482WLU4_LAOST|nr:hypothetical protein LSTR_LSTR011741 [Laodelphax striatellus]
MSSLSLPRMLHNRKTSLEVEKENFEKFQASSISKAINCHEHPVKEKHVRSAILGTFHEKSSETFWKCVLRLPLMENKIVAWKFCHVLHKVLREGHPQVIPYSQRFRPKIDDIGKLWGHLKEGYGKLIQLYCKLLLEKLAFHRRNPRFPGNLVVSKEELDSIGENDINNYFQMSVEMFDYMDEILVLQTAIFGSLDMSRSNSMTSSGQCILAPLIPIIQDSSQLYDYCVKILFKLHASVPADMLAGHRDRFLKHFVQLRHFYYNAATLQDNLIEHLQHEISRQRAEIEHLSLEHQETISRLSERINHLELELARKDSELAQERLAKEDLLAQTEGASRCAEAEKRAKTIEEKFQKLKEVYTKLREEHIQLIRQKADVDKQLVNVKNLDLENSEKTRLEEVLEELSTLQASADAATEQNQALSSKVDWVEKEKAQIESELQDLLSQKEEVDSKLTEAESRLKSSIESQDSMFEKCCLESERIVQHAIDEVDNPAMSATCTCDYLDSLVEPLRETVSALEKDLTVELVVQLAHRSAAFIFCAKANTNMSPDIEAGERMAKELKTVGEMCLALLKNCRLKEPRNGDQFREKIVELSVTGRRINAVLTTEQIVDMVEDELASMDKAIEEAVKGIEEMLKQSRAADSGIKLEVNEKILDSCTTLMKAVKVLVQKARLLQAEIVSQGKGSASVKEFYKRNHQWTEGLISAAKAVAIGAKYLLEAADSVVAASEKGGAQLEQKLRAVEVVASQVISASTVQLVMASRVKAARASRNMAAVSAASKHVMQATAVLVATTKSCSQLIEESDDMDMAGLSLHQAKKLQMELLVRIKELEASLDKERLRFSALRREHFQLFGDTDEPTS